MAETGSRMIEAAKEAAAIARGEAPAARLHVKGHAYVPEQRWQPIETAPRDGTMVLIASKRVRPAVHPARWRGTDADAAPFHHWDAWQHWFVDGDLVGWQPLPPPPHQEP